MPAYTSDVHIDQALTTLSIAYSNDGYVADDVLPPVPVDKRTDRYFVYGQEPFKQHDDLVRPGGVAPEFNWTVSQAAYSAERHALRSMITDDVRREADQPINMDIDTTQMLTDAVQNQREFQVLNYVTNPANVPNNVTLSGTTQWSDYTNSTPLADLRTAKAAVRMGALREGTHFTTNYDVALVLADHPDLLELIKYTDPNNIANSGLPATIRGLRTIVSSAFLDTANQGQVADMQNAFGNNALVHYTSATAGLKTLSFGYRFEAPDATTGVRGFATIRYRQEERHGDWIEVCTTYAMRIVAPTAAYLFVAAIA